jgi:hypothetical protein
MDEHSSELMRRWQTGDQSAAETLFRRYFTRLHTLVQTRMSAKMAARFDADDVIQSAFRSFFNGAKDGKFVLKHAGDLWRLLAAIAINKMRHEERQHSADKRSLNVEQRYRPEGLSITSGLAESLVAGFNARVKSRKQFWNRPVGAVAMLQLRAALLIEDGRLERYFAERLGSPYRRKAKNG